VPTCGGCSSSPAGEIVALLRPGDILTHCFTGGGHRLLTEDGRISPLAAKLQRRGVLLDIGHGAGSFSYQVAEASLAERILPDVISSDIRQLSVQGPMFDLPTTLSKFLNLGMALPNVIDRATRRPAAAIGRPDLGTLAVGARPTSPCSSWSRASTRSTTWRWRLGRATAAWSAPRRWWAGGRCRAPPSASRRFGRCCPSTRPAAGQALGRGGYTARLMLTL
jgi:hypothetical protein